MSLSGGARPSDHGLRRWYAVHTRPKQEDRAAGNLRGQHIEVFTPVLCTPRRAGSAGRARDAITPLFAGYLFARFDPEVSLVSVRYTRGVHRVIGCGDEPVPVDDEIIGIIRGTLDARGIATLRTSFVAGDAVVIEEGPLKDLMGIVERPLKNSDRVLILLTAVHWRARVAVDRHFVGLRDSRRTP
jgi:transcriptional antiterminator RfaH